MFAFKRICFAFVICPSNCCSRILLGNIVQKRKNEANKRNENLILWIHVTFSELEHDNTAEFDDNATWKRAFALLSLDSYGNILKFATR